MSTQSNNLNRRLAVVLMTVVLFALLPAISVANICPFCSAVALTFTEQLESNDIAVVAKLVEIPEPNDDPNANFPKAKFEILKILKGEKYVGEGMTFKTQLVGSYVEGEKFLVLGISPPDIAWTTPMKSSDRVFQYLSDIQELPEKGSKRLIFFQDYFEDEEAVLAFDAYDEFARAPYEDLLGMKEQMDHEKLIGWITDKKTSVNRRRLYFTMLGVCGTKDDIELLEDLIKSKSRKKRAGLDALIACYLNLKGEEGVDLIEETFLIDKETDYVDTLAAVSALRFHGTEVEFVSKKRIVKAVRHLLDRPKMADMIIPDLARWKDWSVMEKLVKMFKEADDESNWLRVPVITYLRACPKPEAQRYIDELQKIDPEAVERADFFLGFDQNDDEEDGWGDGEDSSDVNEEKPDEEKVKSKTESETETDTNSESDADDGSHVVRKVPIPKGSISNESNSNSDATQAIGTFANDSVNEPNTETTFAETQTSFVSSEPAAESPELATNSGVNEMEPDPPVNSEPSVNPIPSTFVSSNSTESLSQPVETQVAQSVTPEPNLVAATPQVNLTLPIIFVPMVISGIIFILLWSVVNGWFERLIF